MKPNLLIVEVKIRTPVNLGLSETTMLASFALMVAESTPDCDCMVLKIFSMHTSQLSSPRPIGVPQQLVPSISISILVSNPSSSC